MAKTVGEINEKIRRGDVVVVTAEEMTDLVRERGAARAAEEVDVVTTGTFGPMCSSGAFINVGHSAPKCKITKATLNGVPACCGLAAVDLYIGATELHEDDPRNEVYPGRFRYGGAHVIEDLVAGRDVELRAAAYGTDCYPRRKLETLINIRDLNEAVLCNPRNCYQNYNVAVNLSDRVIHTYMGVLRPKLGNANYCSAGGLSPLLCDPFYRTIGVGTRIFLGGGVGHVWSAGTQHSPASPRDERGVPLGGAGTLALTGDLKGMSTRWIRGASLTGYGVSLCVGIGVPIPVLDEDVAAHAAVSDEDITAPIVDYSDNYPNAKGGALGHVSYAALRSGEIEVRGRRVPTAGLSSLAGAREIAGTLKDWIAAGRFLLAEAVAPLPSAESGLLFKPLPERPINNSPGSA